MKNLWVRGSVPVGLCLCAQLLAIPSTTMGQPFTTVINVPTDIAPRNIGSDTQLNLFDGGSLQPGFTLAGTLYGLNSHIEANIYGGTAGNRVLVGIPKGLGGTNSDVTLNISGGVVGSELTVSPGGTVNITGGTVGDRLEVESGGVVNMSGGSLGDYVIPRNGSTFSLSGGSIGQYFEVHSYTTLNISGGTIGDHFTIGLDTTVSISGGVVPEFYFQGGTLGISGGNLGGFFGYSDGTTITGSEFRLDGAPIPGLEVPGNSVTIPTNSGLLTTTFTDGAVIAFSPGSVSGTLTLNAVEAPTKRAVINSPSEPVPLGLRYGQTLNLATGAELVDYFTAIDSTLNVDGGNIGRELKAMGTTVEVTGGSVGENFLARSGSTVNISGGVVEHGMGLSQSTAVISGGTVGWSLDVGPGSQLDLSGGTIGMFFESYSGSTVNIHSGSLRLDGVPVPGLDTPGLAVDLNLPGGSILTGRLTDGSVFVFSSQSGDQIADGTLKLIPTLVPDAGPSVIDVPTAPAPTGLWVGQTLNLSAGGTLGDNFAAIDAEVNIAGGTVGQGMEVVGSTVRIEGGEVGQIFTVMEGSTVDITGGHVGDYMRALSGSTINITDGELGEIFTAGDPDGSSADITVNISGGTIGNTPLFYAGATANISGGDIGHKFFASAGSTINLIGSSFILDGVDLALVMTPEEAYPVIDRDVILEGVLADGSLFSFELNRWLRTTGDVFDPAAMLTVTLVPEPGAVALLGVGGLLLARRRYA